MRQERKPEAGKYKHYDAEHPVWIFDTATYFFVCFVLQRGPKRHLSPQLSGISFGWDQIVHLPIPSEGFRQRGKKISEIFSADDESTIGRMRPRCGMPYRKITKVDSAKESAETREKSEETMDAISTRCCTLLTLTAVDHRRSARHKVAL